MSKSSNVIPPAPSPPQPPKDESWISWSVYVVESIKQIFSQLESLESDIDQAKLKSHENEITAIKEAYAIKETLAIEIKKLSKELEQVSRNLLVLQTKFIIINAIASFVITAGVSIAVKLLW